MSEFCLDESGYPIRVGSGILESALKSAPKSRKALVVTQGAARPTAERVAKVLEKAHGTAANVIELADGEAAKDLEQIRALYEAALELRLERTDAVFAVGGGTVGDAAGFFAATYLRGIPLVQVPTTLLAQVDSSIGGKVGVNLGNTKNMVGAFYNPAMVICDIATLDSLPEDQVRNGLGEVIKYGLILDADFFSYMESHLDDVFAKEPAALIHVVKQSAQLKGAIVARDERESGERMKLNYGHTLGHGIETVTGLPHGFAISVGMHAAGILSVKKNATGSGHGFNTADLERQNALLESAGLPLRVKADADAVMEKVRNDKKRAGGQLRMALLDSIGTCRIDTITENDARKALEQVLD